MNMTVELRNRTGDDTGCATDKTPIFVMVPSEPLCQTLLLNEVETPTLPSNIIPIPKVTIKRNHRSKGKKSKLFSSSPYKKKKWKHWKVIKKQIKCEIAKSSKNKIK